MSGAPSRKRIWIARGLALCADAIQILVFPLFGEGALSPLNDVLDVLMAGAMVVLVGWHWAFLPAFIAELVPAVDLVPTWTVAVWLATRGGAKTAPPRAEREAPPTLIDVTPRRNT